ncbi:hypothetical protein A2617_02555, partial [Candidatus Daviesbacteria bacterium RIFOXYD1_FULL_41_10]
MKIIVDTDALLALINPLDSLHSKAKTLLTAMFAQEVQLFLLPTTLSEFALIAASRVGLNQTKAVIEVWTGGVNHQMIEIDKELISNAVKLFQKQTSKEESLFDCFIMAAAGRYKYDAIFSFDKGYLKKINVGQKLKLVSD